MDADLQLVLISGSSTGPGPEVLNRNRRKYFTRFLLSHEKWREILLTQLVGMASKCTKDA
jgi:hypothetical protein